MVDTDNVLFQARKNQNSTGQPFNDLEQGLRLAKGQVDELEFRLDELGIACGGAS